MPISVLGSEEELGNVMKLFKKCKNTTWQIGQRVEKVQGEPKDVHLIGDVGTVMGGLVYDEHELYMVEFDNDASGTPVIILGNKLKAIP